MPFFENARQFEIHGGSFIDLKGNQNNYNYDNSMNVTGNNNTANFSRNQNNYNYKDCLNVNGNNNSGNFTNGNYYNGANNSITNRCSGQMTVIGQGANARVAIDPTMMSSILNQSQKSIYSPPPQPNYGQGYAQPPANFSPNASPHAQPYNYGPYQPPNGSLQPPPTGMFNNNSTGHLNQQFYPSPPQHQQPQHVPNSFPPSSPPMGHQPYAPAHHSQTSVNSAPGSVQHVQIAQSTPQPHAAHTNGLLSPSMMPQQPALPQIDIQTRPPLSGATVAQSSQSTATTGTALSGATLVQSPGSTYAAAPPSASSTATTATQSPTPSTSTTTSPVTLAQPASSTAGNHNLSEFADIPLKAGATPSIHEGPVTVNVDKKKKKKRKFFSGLFGKAPKEV